MARLAANHAAGLDGALSLASDHVQQLQTVHDRRQWVSQLVRQRCDEFIFPAIRLAQRRLARLSCRNVPPDFGRSDHLPGAITDRRHGQGYIHSAAILGDAHRFEVLDPLATAEAGNDLLLLIVQLGRNDHRYRPAERLGLGVSEYARSPRVPRADGSIRSWNSG